MPGAYLAAILLSACGVFLLDRRFRLTTAQGPARTLIAVALGTAFFAAWDLAGIALGVFRQGDSPHYLGLELAPHLPIEEIAFLAFLSYLALVLAAAALRWPRRAPHGPAGDASEEVRG